MKNFFLHTLFSFLVFANGLLAQDFPKTYTENPCVNCAPPGYTVVSGGPVALSNMTGVGGAPLKDWVNGFPDPPSSSSAYVVDRNTGNVFLTLKYNSSQQDKVRTNVISGFEVGIKYTLTYYVMTSRAHLTAATISDYATSAKVEVSVPNGQGGYTSLASKVTSFTPGVNVDGWIAQTLTFVAPATDMRFELSSSGSLQGVSYVNFDIHSKPFDCVVPGGQAELVRAALTTPFPCDVTDLYKQIKSTTPINTTPVWSKTSTHGFTQMTYDDASHAKTSLSGEDYYLFYRSANGCYNTGISTAKLTFTAQPTQVSLLSNQKSINCINQTGVDLTAQIAPTNYKVHWFTNDKHQGIPVDNPQAAPVNSYYAFYFDSKNNCYSVDKAAASAMFLVIGSTMCCNDPSDPSNQIPLLNTDVKIVAPAQTYDLAKLVPANISMPPNTVIEWYTTADHSGSPVPDPQHAGPGKYYVFAHDLSNGCFNVPLSKSSVNVSKACYAGTTPVTLKDNSDNYYCQEGEPPINLSDFVVGAPPAGLSVMWFDNQTHSGNSVTNGTVNGGQYYAYYYDNLNQCYSPPSSPIDFLSKHVPLVCGENPCQLSTGCPAVGIDLGSLHIGTVPGGWELRWFKNPTHSGEQITNPGSVTQSGEYYAFYYHTAKQCYNKSGVLSDGQPDQGLRKAIVTNPCAGPQLEVKVALQGVVTTKVDGNIMRTDLQTYFGDTGLLPTTSPYGDLATCPDINNTSKIDDVVDWVKVEVRDAVDPSILLESKSLLLGATGFVINLDGTSQPSFTSQSKAVRIVIKHRNHLAVMSNPIQDFSSGVVSYDFTTALSQASNAFGDPPQMVQKNNIWCMWVGDVNAVQDLGIEGTDFNEVYKICKESPFDTYSISDVNMDGGVDGNDFNLEYSTNLVAPYSTLINY